jgi:hypothetical protein
MKIFYYIRKFWEISEIERKLLFKGYVFSLISFLILKNLPLKYCLMVCNNKSKSKQDFNDSLKIKLARTSIHRLIRFAPWLENCFVKALTLNYILSLLSIESNIILSLRKSDYKTLSAHAYVLVDKEYSYFKDIRYSDIYSLKTNY